MVIEEAGEISSGDESSSLASTCSEKRIEAYNSTEKASPGGSPMDY